MLVRQLKFNGEIAENYVISSEGEVWNIKSGKKLKLQETGYLHVRIPVGESGKYRNVRIHRAVAETFLKNPKKLGYVNHIDEDKTNNRVENLCWVSQSENVQHSADLRKGRVNVWEKRDYLASGKPLIFRLPRA